MAESNKKKLIIVDDEINLLQTLQFIFEDNGFEVTMANSGIEAVEMIKKSGQQGVPVIDIGGKIIVGFDKNAIKEALGLN